MAQRERKTAAVKNPLKPQSRKTEHKKKAAKKNQKTINGADSGRATSWTEVFVPFPARASLCQRYEETRISSNPAHIYHKIQQCENIYSVSERAFLSLKSFTHFKLACLKKPVSRES